MNLDDLRRLMKGITTPTDSPSTGKNLDSFIAQMRAQDQKQRRLALGMALTLLSLGTVFVVVGVRASIGTELIGLGIMLSSGYIYLKGRGFGRVDYAAPAQEFLAAAAKRYSFLGMKDVLALIPLLVMGLGGGLVVHHAAVRHLTERGAGLALGGYVMFLVALCVFALVVSRKDWREAHADLLREIRQRQQELQNG